MFIFIDIYNFIPVSSCVGMGPSAQIWTIFFLIRIPLSVSCFHATSDIIQLKTSLLF